MKAFTSSPDAEFQGRGINHSPPMAAAAAATALYGTRPPFSVSPKVATRLCLYKLRLKKFFACPPRELFIAMICSGHSATKFEKGGQVRKEIVNCVYTEEPDEEDEEDENFELLFRIASNIIKRMSKHAAKLAIDLLPPMVSSELVVFSVNGIVVLGFIWILKALLELTCVVGSIIFVGILLMRGMWSIICYFHLYQNQDVDSSGKVDGNLRARYS